MAIRRFGNGLDKPGDKGQMVEVTTFAAMSSGTVVFPTAFGETPHLLTMGLNAEILQVTLVTPTGFTWNAQTDAGAAQNITSIHYQATQV